MLIMSLEWEPWVSRSLTGIKLTQKRVYISTQNHTRTSKVVHLDTRLISKKIDALPVATIECYLMPVFGHTSTPTQAHDIQI